MCDAVKYLFPKLEENDIFYAVLLKRNSGNNTPYCQNYGYYQLLVQLIAVVNN